MGNIESFPDIIKAVTDVWGLLALAVLVLGILALQMTKGAHANVRVVTFLVILGFFGGFLYLAVSNGAVAGNEAVATVGAAQTPDAAAIEADAEAAARYRESVGGAYDSAAGEMDEVARMIEGGGPSDGATAAEVD